MKLLIVGNPGVEHVGAHFLNAAGQMGIKAHCFDSAKAFDDNVWKRRFNWWLRGRRPGLLQESGEEMAASLYLARPNAFLTTGIAPVSEFALKQAGQLGIPRLNFLTDDPWNRAHRAPWFLRALRLYDHVFSPRRANLDDLRRHGCKEVTYLPFAYAPEIHFPDEGAVPLLDHDVVFIGGADLDRMLPVLALIDAGIRVALYGGYWDRDSRTQPFARGFVDPAGLRRVIGGSKVVLGLVRRANRDGHSMRTYEVPAMRGCLLTEDTAEHREILGDTVYYFRDHKELVENARGLLADDALRARLSQAAHARITGGGNTYRDRLEAMLPTDAARPGPQY
jgi:spore maturation protein CgeB